MQIDEPVDPRERLPDLLRLVAQDVQIGAVDAHDDRLARSGQHLSDPLLQIGLHVAIEPGIAVDHLLDRGQRLVVVDRRIDADPVLGEVDAVHLVGDERLADVGAAVAHARDGPQLLTGRDRDPDHLRMRRAGLGHPVHQEVALLERRQQRLPEQRAPRRRRPATMTPTVDVRRARRADDPREQRARSRAAASGRAATRGARSAHWRSRIRLSAGVTVSATTSDASTASA